jgi:RHS repeat-associated protein
MNGFLVRRFWTWLPGLLMAIGPVSAQAQTVEYLHTDALGTLVAVTNSAGVVIERSEYEPYGKLLNRPLTDGPGFTGHVQDAATGLTYMQQRYYDPGIGRFLSTDPVQANPNTGASFNRYVYASNNPYKFIDPDGRSDVNYFHGTDVLNDAAERFDIPGFTTVMGHSTAKNYRDDREFKPGTEVGYDSLKSDISSTFRKNDYIFLGGCSLGFRNTPERLAKDFNTSVVAATGYVRRSESSNGDITYSVNSRTDGKGVAGSFRIARPDGSSSGKIASVTMRADGKVTFKAAEAPLGSRIKPTVTVDPNRR